MPATPAALSAVLDPRRGPRALCGWLAEVCGGIFFLDSRQAGLLLLAIVVAAAWALRPAMALGGALALATCALLQFFAGQKLELRVGINCLLIGFGAGHLFGPTTDPAACAAFATVAVAASALVFVLAKSLLAWGLTGGLPVLSLPFAIGMVLLQAGAPALNGVFGYAHDPAVVLWPAFDHRLPAYANAFFRDLGGILFLSDSTAGACLFLVILWQSRLLAFHGLLAHMLGVWLLGLWLGNPQAALHHPSNFNFPLTGFALGAFFLLPSWGSAAFSALGVLACALLVVALGRITGLAESSPSTLPFNLTAIAVVALLRRRGSPLIPFRHRGTPEETLDAELCNRARFGSDVSLALPFAETCRVYQAFDGPWTHQGAWRHAYDFVRCDASGRSHRNHGLELADYHLFGLEVLAPAAGTVVAYRDDLTDNPPGHIDHVNNWGNFILLRMPNGLHVELSHLQQGSVRVKPGDPVAAGQTLARCGNSGYSLYPHLHLQVQTGPWLGDETLPFTFRHARYRRRLHTACLPPTGQDVTAPRFADAPSPLALTLGEVLEFDWDDGRGKPRAIRLTVRRTRDIHACFYFEDEAGATLRFAADRTGYVALDYAGAADSPLAFFAACLPSLPNLADGGRYRDQVPAHLACGRLHRHLLLLACALGYPSAPLGLPRRGTWKMRADGRQVRGRMPNGPTVFITFDASGRLRSVRRGRHALTRRIPCPA